MTNKKEKEYVKDAAAVGVLDGPVGQLLKDRSGRELELVGQDPEGHLITNPLVGEVPTQLCTVVSSRLVLGYGGPIAVENKHGLQKAFHEDVIYTLSDGNRYVVPSEIHEALGIPLPLPDPAELAAIREQAGLPPEEVESPVATSGRPDLTPRTDDLLTL